MEIGACDQFLHFVLALVVELVQFEHPIGAFEVPEIHCHVVRSDEILAIGDYTDGVDRVSV